MATSSPPSSPAVSDPSSSPPATTAPGDASAGAGCGGVPVSPPALTSPEVLRYGRQLILPAFGPSRQRLLKAASVLVVGAGGLGCPVVLYLAAAGVGRLGIVDHDVVDVSNLHRQVAHTEARAGTSKAASLKATVAGLNSTVEVETHETMFTGDNGVDLVTGFDVVVDATDNPGTRYRINDACVLAGKPLVSGAALGLNGQLSVYHHAGGPCYRCVYPDPPPRTSFVSCSDGGVLGPVPGLIGTQQAMETIKLLTGVGKVLSQRLLVYDAEDCMFRVMKLRGRSATCAVCGDSPTIKTLADSDAFCAAHDVPSVESCPAPRTDAAARAMSVSCSEYAEVVKAGTPHVLLDVRVPVQFEICALEKSVNVPLTELRKRGPGDMAAPLLPDRAADAQPPIYTVCRRGIDSLKAVEHLRSIGVQNCFNIAGGLEAWHYKIDASLPRY